MVSLVGKKLKEQEYSLIHYMYWGYVSLFTYITHLSCNCSE